MLHLNRAVLRLLMPIILFEFVVLSLTSQTTLRAQTVHLSASTRRIVFDASAIRSGSPAPQWNNGYLVSRELETFQADGPNVRLYDQSGNQVRQAVVWFPGSQRVLIYSAIATSDGRIIAAGKAEKATGEAASFIALTDLAGKLTTIIQTKGFAPVNICQAPDGTVWSFGGTGYDEHGEPNPGDTIRHFDFQKGEVGSYFSRSLFPRRLHPGPEVLAYIRCLADEVVAYSTSAHEYLEMRYGGDSPHVYQAETAPSGLRLAGFAATGSKNVFGYFSHGGSSGLYSLWFDQAASSASWRPVEGTVGDYATSGVITALWGSDGDKLLVSRARDSAGDNAIHWTTPVVQ